MPIFDTKYPKPDLKGQALLNKQKREAELETAERSKGLGLFNFQAVTLRPVYRVTRPNEIHLEGGLLCPRVDARENHCLTSLTVAEDKITITCPVCGYTNKLPKPFDDFYSSALEACKGRVRWMEAGGQIVNLDVPFEAVKASSENDTRAVKVIWSQKDGRDMAVIYFIDKSENQSGDKVHSFVDIDREELRYDAGDTPPHKVLSKIIAEFSKAKIEINYRQEDLDDK